MNGTSLVRLAMDLSLGRVSSIHTTESCLEAALDMSGEGARVFTVIHRDGAIRQAQIADQQLHNGQRCGPLTGIPISVKDLFDVRGETTTAGSVVLCGSAPPGADAPAVARLRAAGAILIGRTNMTEFAFSGLGINPHFGTPRCPYRRGEGRIPGGSSSGAAVSISDGMALGALGTDTGGSVRIPAALCGVTGFKPSAHRTPLAGVFPLSPSLDSVGVIALTVDCCSRLDSVVSGSPGRPLHSPSLSSLTLGVLQGYVLEGIDDKVAASFDAAISLLSRIGANIRDLSSHAIAGIPELYRNGGIPAAESYSIHSRLITQHREQYDPRVLARILRGASISSDAYNDLINARTRAISEFQDEAAGIDAFLIPTVPRIAPCIEEVTRDDDSYMAANAAMLRNTSIANFIDGCALSIPCHGPGEAPVGLMVMGLRDWDESILSIGSSIEGALATIGRGVQARIPNL
jgi:aspartyl-tRNA(Asn)/glutamyl-tRNA(Gln) amidotransferase subunit A